MVVIGLLSMPKQNVSRASMQGHKGESGGVVERVPDSCTGGPGFYTDSSLITWPSHGYPPPGPDAGIQQLRLMTG